MPSCVELTIENIQEIDPYNAFVNSVRNPETLRKYQNQLHTFLKLIPGKIYADLLGKMPENNSGGVTMTTCSEDNLNDADLNSCLEAFDEVREFCVIESPDQCGDKRMEQLEQKLSDI